MAERTILYVLSSSRLRPVTCQLFETTSPINASIKKAYSFGLSRSALFSSGHGIGKTDRSILMKLFVHQALHFSEIRLTSADSGGLVREMIQTGRTFWMGFNGKPLEWGSERDGNLFWSLEADDRNQPEILLSAPASVIMPTTPLIYLDCETGTCGEIQMKEPVPLAFAWISAPAMDTETIQRFCSSLIDRFPGCEIPSPATLDVETIEGVVPTPCLHFSQPPSPSFLNNEHIPYPAARLLFEYEGHKFEWNADQKFVRTITRNRIRKVLRNDAAEAEARQFLKAVGFRPLSELLPAPPRNGFDAYLGFDGTTSANGPISISDSLNQLQCAGWRIVTEENRELRLIQDDSWYADLSASEWNWFELETGIRVDGTKINLLPILHGLLHQFKHLSLDQIREHLRRHPVSVPLNERESCILPPARLWRIVEKLFELFDTEPLNKKQRLEIDSLRAAEIIELEELSPEPWDASKRVRKLVDMLRSGLELGAADPPDRLETELRPYQKQGLSWLQFLRDYEMDGILADDMGLGKTVQTLAHLLAEKQGGRLSKPALVIAPTSLMKNWKDEATRFTPDLMVTVLHGTDRKGRFDTISNSDLILTTYALIRRDIERYRELSFSFVVLDEAQAIKNPKSQSAELIRELKSDRRLCLTGTPLENHLGELWSLFHFLMPGFLGSKESFKARFRDPIEKLGLTDRQTFLSRRIAPFLLRRTKDEVERDLPPKTEVIHTIELSDKQRDLYETVRSAMDVRIRKEIETKGLKRSHIIILDALLKLRQVCCDPRLLDHGKYKAQARDSAKLVFLMEQLPELIEEGRRILLFSQFTSMLALIEAKLRKARIRYVKLTGSTRDRATPIEQFQNREVPLFLISLKAGGTGLNLTAADTVIHYDPWWNPAVENQATDRAHRIGQDKPVFVYKLLTEGTVEAKIQKMQEKKKRLADAILSGSIKDKLAFTEDDLAVLFERVGD